jgi:hypothetical protein
VPPLAQIFGVRHFSPAGALQLRAFLDELEPRLVLIEGPSDATELLKHLANKKTRPPVALLAFTRAPPVRTLVYPMAAYSPEWVALQWALSRKKEVRFIDLPAQVFLELHELEEQRERRVAEEAEPERAASAPPRDHTQAYLDDPYETIALLSGQPDHETWWEREFEHLRDPGSYRGALLEFGKGLREVRAERTRALEDSLLRQREVAREQETLLREAYMRREILAGAEEPESIAVVCGAYHASALHGELPPMTDAEAEALPRADCVLTLMPYSYPRLSSQSGYGAGNHAPAYFEALFEEGLAGTSARLPARYLAELAGHLRRDGNVRSSADVIEAVRLAEGLACLNDSPAPVLRDLRDAAVTLLGQGSRVPLEKALRQVEIGTAIGQLPPGVSRTALQDDFHRLVTALKLDRYLEDKEQGLELDLREDRFKKTEAAAFLDRRRSTFLHRLGALAVEFAAARTREQKGTAKEAWRLRWTPECEIRLAERSIQADSIESGAALALAEQLGEAKDVGEATLVLLRAASCELAEALAVALRRVQHLAVDDSAFASLSRGLENIAELIRYGNVREVDPAPLRPILQQLYLRACLLVFGSSVCSDDAAPEVRAAMDRVHAVAFLGEEGIDPEGWCKAIGAVSRSDDRNPFLSGYATGLLVERGKIDDASIDTEVSRRLSPGTEASVGVNWFEGLVQRNRGALFLRKPLWASLSAYVDTLDEEAFKRALLYLRRAFSTFEPGEVRRVVGLLGEGWKGVGAQELAREVERKLDPEELEKTADDLDGLDLV